MDHVMTQDNEVVTKATRRKFTAEYKREVLRQAAACVKPGELGAMLRREGLYSSHLATWRREMEAHGMAGLAPKKRGPKAAVASPEELELRRLRRENAVLAARAEKAELLVELQKKMAALLESDFPKQEGDR